MGAKEVLEPALVVGCLTVGVWINRVNPADEAGWWNKPDDREQLLDKQDPTERPRSVYREVAGFRITSRDTRQYSSNWGSRLLRRYPFLVEVVSTCRTFIIKVKGHSNFLKGALGARLYVTITPARCKINKGSDEATAACGECQQQMRSINLVEVLSLFLSTTVRPRLWLNVTQNKF